MNHLKQITLFTFLFLTSSVLVAQVWNIRIGMGFMSYHGDLVANPISLPNSHGALRLGFGAEFFPRLATEFTYLGGNVSSQNVTGLDITKQINFTSPIDNYSLLIKYRLDRMNIHVNRWGLSVLLGGGMMFFEPSENITGTRVRLQELAREGVTYSLQAYEANLGVEIAFMLNRRWILSIQSIYHDTFTDYLDDVSLRVKPDDNDNYMDHTLSLTYRFGNEKAFKNLQQPMKCPAFFN